MAYRIVVMGVSGSGKSTVAERLAATFGARCVDGDRLHAAQSVDKMRRGIGLVDADRWPWLDRIAALLAEPGGSTVVSCSALRRAYRDRLRAACPELRFVFLDGRRELIEQRLRVREAHYMPASLLQSQLQTLERPGADEPDVLHVTIDGDVATVTASVVGALAMQKGQR
jgi:gluconokinase